ncbi:hypothetical protein N9L43_00380 [bacterium]|nr:hypothetical protein [bacterium]
MITNETKSLLSVSRLFATLIVVLVTFTSQTQTRTVTIEEVGSQWQLRVDGEPFYIKGAGGEKHLDVLLEAGGNTIRTWGTDNAQEVLDLAEEKGLMVMMGLWVQHERHGFDYNNEARVKSQLENFRKEIRKYKGHPALLMWGIGNEYELNYSNTKVWKAVNDIAKMVQEEDPNHPTSTVTAGTNAEKLNFVMTQLPDIDIYGINTYGDVGNVKTVIKNGEFQGPYMITEWGPTGHWEITKTMWGASVEQSSSEKFTSYLKRYEENIASEPEQCIGSFAFLWGQKQEYTSTWYGLFTEEGMPTEAIDALQFCWTGSYPENRAPSLDSISSAGQSSLHNLILESGTKYSFTVNATDANDDKLNYRWELYLESTDKKSGGDAEGKPPIILGRIKGQRSPEITLKAPMQEGRYRLFVYVDDNEKVAYVNIPLYVEVNPDSAEKIQFKPQKLEPLAY